jgi:4-hydroxymandelate oxidase
LNETIVAVIGLPWWDDRMPHHPLDILAEQGRLRLAPPVAEFVASVAGDGLTDRRNADEFRRYALVPAVGVDVSAVDTRTRLPGVELPHPVVLAPTALHELYHPEGEAATARAAAATGSLFVLSSDASQPLESSAALLPHGFYVQLALWRDSGLVRDLVRRAEEAGAAALVLTLDSAVGGVRYRQERYLPELPSSVSRANLGPAYRDMVPAFIDPSVTWETIETFVSSTRLPVLGKGIVRARDAARGIDAGLAGIIVSNHGGRNLDNAVATLEMLPEVVEAVADRVPVLLDGGVRRGTDVLTALALGARAVLVGRPYVWGLAAQGADGVRTVVDTLVHELRVAMALCGVTSVSDVPRDTVRLRR